LCDISPTIRHNSPLPWSVTQTEPSVADSVGLGIISILVNHFVRGRINGVTDFRPSSPDKSAAKADFTALRNMARDNGHHLVAGRINARDAAMDWLTPKATLLRRSVKRGPGPP